jgi:hypothetical protein
LIGLKPDGIPRVWPLEMAEGVGHRLSCECLSSSGSMNVGKKVFCPDLGARVLDDYGGAA